MNGIQITYLGRWQCLNRCGISQQNDAIDCSTRIWAPVVLESSATDTVLGRARYGETSCFNGVARQMWLKLLKVLS